MPSFRPGIALIYLKHAQGHDVVALRPPASSPSAQNTHLCDASLNCKINVNAVNAASSRLDIENCVRSSSPLTCRMQDFVLGWIINFRDSAQNQSVSHLNGGHFIIHYWGLQKNKRCSCLLCGYWIIMVKWIYAFKICYFHSPGAFKLCEIKR